MRVSNVVTAVVLAALLLSAGAAYSVEVIMYRPPNDDWSWDGPMPEGQLGLVHCLIARLGGDRNGPDAIHTGIRDNYVPGEPFPSWAINMVQEDGNGISDNWEFGVLEYAYLNPDAPGHAIAKQAFDHNLDTLYFWTGPEGPCAGTDVMFYADFTYRDEFGNTATVDPDVVFPPCTPSTQWILWQAAHVTVSDYGLGIDGYATGWWVWANNFRDYPMDFTTDPRFDRSAVALFGGNGDLNGDGITNLAKYQSFARAWEAGWRPAGYDAALAAIPDSDPMAGTKRGRLGSDLQLGAYIDLVMFTEGYHPADPDAPPLPCCTNFRVASQSQSQWFLATPGTPLELFVTVASAEGTVTYQWYKDGVALSASDPHYAGVQTGNLTVNPPLSQAVDGGNYWCVMTDESEGKATISSAPIEITIFAEGELPAAGAFGLGVLGSLLALAALRRFRR